MNGPTRWQLIEDIFHTALKRAPHDRARFLQHVCQEDETLRRQVESLLAAEGQKGDFLDSEAIRDTAKILVERGAFSLVGNQVAHYQVLSLLGAGGMGEVYLAKDTKLSRKVALKLLPAQFGQDQERVRRFEREARAASALNHPNIITIYEIGESDDLHFIVTEYVEGHTLRQLMATARMPAEQTIDILKQIARALAAAHQADILHRDIKPENVMVRPDGLVKVLDFGLARISKRVAPSLDSQTLAQDRTLTIPGAVMGTIGYMSPEQARGLTLDTRTDIFSLGVIFYELLSGHVPFSGATPSDVIAAILTIDPPPLTLFPPALQHVVSRALSKEREHRYQTSGELLADLEKLSRDWEPVRTTDQVTSATDDREHNPASDEAITQRLFAARTHSHKLARYKRPALSVLLAVLVAVGLAYAGKEFVRKFRPLPFQTITATSLTHAGRALNVSLSPDEKYVAYVTKENGLFSLSVRQIATGSVIQFLPPGKPELGDLAFSQDSNYLYYEAAGVLYRAPSLGGAATQVLAGIASRWALAPNEKRLVYVRTNAAQGESALMISNLDGSDERKLATRKLSAHFYRLAWSPDSQVIAFVDRESPDLGFDTVRTISIADGTEKLITPRRWSRIRDIAWLPAEQGWLISASDQRVGRIWHLPKGGGEARQITFDASHYDKISLVATGKSLAAITNDASDSLWVSPTGDASQARRLMTGRNDFYDVRWTPDGKLIFTNHWGTGANEMIHRVIITMNADGSDLKQLTAGTRAHNQPLVSPDGRYIVSTRDARPERLSNLWRFNADGSKPVQLTYGDTDHRPSWSLDSRWVVYLSTDRASKGTVWRVSAEGGTPEQLTTVNSGAPVVSPDGQWIACALKEAEDKPWRLALIPFVGGPPTRTFELPAELHRNAIAGMRWMPDGRALAYRKITDGAVNLWRQPIDGGTPTPITDFKTDGLRGFDWSRDGKLVFDQAELMGYVVLLRDLK